MMNFQSEPEYEKKNFECFCGKRDSQNHALFSCVLYDDLLSLYDTTTTEGIVDFFDAVLKRREEEDDSDEKDDDDEKADATDFDKVEDKQ